MLDGEIDDAGTTRRFLEVARREALRLARLVDGMLDFSMLDLSVPRARGSTAIDAAIASALDALAPIAEDAGVEVRQCSSLYAHVRIDADSCMHALLNVIENAIK